MSYSNGLLPEKSSNIEYGEGEKGDPGVGFKLDSNGNYDLENKKLTNVQNGDSNHDVMVKSQIEAYVSNKTAHFVLKTGDIMTGDLVVPKDNYPIKGDLNKVISYETQREIFLSKRERGQMMNSIDMGNNFIENLKTPTNLDHACSKRYADDNFLKKSGGVMVGPISMNRNDLIGLPDSPKFGYSAVNRTYVTNQLDLKLDKAADIDMKNKKNNGPSN